MFMQLDIPIIPINQTFYDAETNKIVPWNYNSSHPLDYKAIAAFMALGFFLDDDTYFKRIKIIFSDLFSFG